MYILHHRVTKLTIYNIILKSTYTLYNFEFTFDLHITYIFVAMHISKTLILKVLTERAKKHHKREPET